MEADLVSVLTGSGSTGVVALLFYLTITKTLPKMTAEFREALREQSAKFTEALHVQRESFREDLREERRQLGELTAAVARLTVTVESLAVAQYGPRVRNRDDAP